MSQPSQSTELSTTQTSQEFLPDEVEIRRELLSTLFGHTRSALGGNVVVGVLTAAVLMNKLDQRIGSLSVWLSVLLLLLLARALHVRRLSSQIPAADLAALGRFEKQSTVLIGACGLMWGLLPLMGFAGTYGFIDFFIMATLLGMGAGAINSTLALPRALGTYLLCMGLPFVVVRAFAGGGAMDWGGGLTVLVTMGFLWATARSSYQNLRGNLVMTHQNRRFAQALAQERDNLRLSMQVKDLFHAGVTHDLRQPVHAIALHLRYLRRLADLEFDRTTLDQNCTAMETALHAMSRQLTRLLDLSRLESGEIRPDLARFSLGPLLQENAAKFSAAARSKGLRWRLHTLDAVVHSDRQMLQSIIDNLVSNAVRYTTHGGVLVAARRRAGQLQVCVYDTGPGIPADVLPQLFEAYRRFDDRRDGAEEGYGLGLAMVAKQVEVLGHTLNVRSVPGRGTVFSVMVPLANV